MASLSISPCNHHEWTLRAIYTEFNIMPWLTVSRFQPVSYLSSLICHLSTHIYDPQFLGFRCCTLSSIVWGWQLNKSINSRLQLRLPIDHLQIYHLDVVLQFRSIVASITISKLAQLWHSSFYSDGIPGCLQTGLITTSKWMSKLTPLGPANASPNLLDQGLQRISDFPWSQPPSSSPNSLNQGLQGASPKLLDLHLDGHTIMAIKYVSKLAQSQPRSASLGPLNRHVQVLRWLQSTIWC